MTAALDSARVDADVRPQDDLFRHVNGRWLSQAPIDADKSSAGSFVDLTEKSRMAVRAIVDELATRPAVETPTEEADKIATLYRDFLDEDAIELLGSAPLQPLLARVEQITGTVELARHWGWCLGHGIGSIVGLGPDADMADPTRYAVFLEQAGLGLPDRDYYLAEEHAELLAGYRAHVERSLTLAGVDDATAQADDVLALETELARRHWERERTRDLNAKYNPSSWAELSAAVPTLHLDEVAAGLGCTAEALPLVINSQPSFLTEAGELVTDERLPQWRAWARWQIVAALSPWLSRAFVEERFDFYEHTLQGIQEQKPRWKRGVALVESAMGEAVGRLYVERHFPASSKAGMDELVANLLAAYRESIGSLDWMGEQTRAEALRKLSAFTPKIGHPEHWRSYADLELVPGDLVGNVLRVDEFETRYQLGKLTRPVDPDEWLMTPQTVNAYYHPLRNEIVFPAAILQPPFFNPEADDAVNYGGIGSVIGHEIGHGFDDQGSTCDGDGVLRNWWTEADRAAFTERTAVLVEQFNALTPRQLADDQPPVHVNGAFTIGENIGDLGGVGIALKAWRLATGGVEPEPIDALSGTQRFFHGYAAIWCNKARDEMARRLLVVDPHSPAEFRCNQIVRNVDAFHEAFGTTPDDAMWLDPEQRVSIW
ncbi:M13-type metalloendopeptidase [Luteococcus sp. H138]|uniref:M13 family metallopeptidase n=1 Tax=unclassified Luteococcus TaxID=2639923 RepID=UPI00313B557E